MKTKKTKAEKTIDEFIGISENEEEIQETENIKKVVLEEREGLIERVDKILVTKDGKQLLREWY